MTITPKLTELFHIQLPIIQAPMAGAQDHKLAIAVANAGGLGSIACASIDAEVALARGKSFREASQGSLNMNFFCHRVPDYDEAEEKKWRAEFAPFYAEHQIDSSFAGKPSVNPIDNEMCDVLAEIKPEVVSFHFGLPAQEIVERVRSTGAKIICSATTREEAVFLEQSGCDAIIAQGSEAGGHRGLFLNDDLATQTGTMALLPQVVDAVSVPVIAAGGIADGRGIAAALVLGASAVQIGTRFLKTPESTITDVHRKMLLSKDQPQTALTNVFSGRPARSFVNRLVAELGPINPNVSTFPQASKASVPLKAVTAGSPDFVSLWAGQSAHIGSEMPAEKLTKSLYEGALAVLGR